MSRYYDYVVIEFVDGSIERVGGNRDRIYEGLLIVSTEGSYGGDPRDVRHFPLVNIKSYRWEGS